MQHVLILAGGGGTRLWPASRRKRPKQLLPLGAGEGESLLAATARRAARVVPVDRVWVVTAAEQEGAVRADVPALPAGNIVAEPVGRNTAPAIGLGVTRILAQDPEAVIGVLPADQHVADETRFAEVAGRALAVAGERDCIVTIGIPPVRPETGFGYLEVEGAAEPARVVRFVEKPDRATAERYVHEGYLWNAGMFFFRGRRLLAELEALLPRAAELLRRGAEAYAEMPSISIDYAVMEKTQTPIYTLRGDMGWNDVGTWSALADVRPADAQGNVAAGLVIASDAAGNIAVADEGTMVALVGVRDLVVVKSGNAILVVPRERAQDVREIVRILEQRGLDAYL